jgi:hypothetical protein
LEPSSVRHILTGNTFAHIRIVPLKSH